MSEWLWSYPNGRKVHLFSRNDDGALRFGKSLRRKLKQHLPGYDKQLPANEMFAALDSAIKRAAELYERQQRNDNIDKSPCTTVHKLVARIIKPPA